MFNEPYHLITFGAGGHTCHAVDMRSEGYETPDTLFKPYHWHTDPVGVMSRHVEPGQAEGAIVVDIREAVKTREGFAYVFAGPLPDIRLPDEGYTPAPVPSPLMAVALREADATFALVLNLQATHDALKLPEPGPLDQVGRIAYAAGWKRRGARIGVVHNDTIIWEE